MKKPKTSNIFRSSAVIKKLFWFLRKQEKPQVTWWSSVDGLEKVVPILPAKEFMPDWFKNIERSEESTLITKGTVKVCPSFPEFFAQYVLFYLELRFRYSTKTVRVETRLKINCYGLSVRSAMYNKWN